ncbi:MAG: cobalamin biosynthesis protein CobD [Ruminococcus sp.]|nr:cobalamin biosynthesis protein CobD [Ruminococcus sp.]
MLVNSLCALALGFVLDLVVGDPEGKVYPLRLIERLAKTLEHSLRKAYSDTPEAQNMAGIMLVVMTLLICLGGSLALLMIGYLISPVVGIIVEGVLCCISISVKQVRLNLQSAFRAAKTGNVLTLRRAASKLSNRDTDDLDLEGAMKCSIEAASENLTDWVVGPVFWIMILGGLGGILCRCINVLDNTVGYKDKEHIDIGSTSAKLDDIMLFLPARIAAGLMKINVAFLALDSEGAKDIYRRDRAKSLSPNSGCTMTVCAGALGVQLGSDEYYSGKLVKKPALGDDMKKVSADDIFWTSQLYQGTAAYSIILAFILRGGLAILLAIL